MFNVSLISLTEIEENWNENEESKFKRAYA